MKSSRVQLNMKTVSENEMLGRSFKKIARFMREHDADLRFLNRAGVLAILNPIDDNDTLSVADRKRWNVLTGTEQVYGNLSAVGRSLSAALSALEAEVDAALARYQEAYPKK
jgi:hypothetical protein